MNRLLRRAIEHLLHVQYKTLTDAQEADAACVLCGREFPWGRPDYRAPWSCLGWPRRHRHYACAHACTLDTIDETADLFRAAIPAGQPVWLWHLGVDDTADMSEQQAEELAAQPHLTVTISHPGGDLATRPLPVTHAARIREQAVRLGFTARTDAYEGSAAR